MCVSVAPARLTGTILYVGRRTHPEHGPVEVLGYQNTVANLATGPNAMLLHLPATGMTRANFLDTEQSPDVLRDLVDALRPVSWAGPASRSVAAGPPQPVEVFDHGVYTVVLAADPRDIPAALDQVPEHKRPSLSPDLFRFYAETFPAYPVALCCFDNAEARRAGPLLMWYQPLFPDRLTAPALDCHTGGVPDVDGWVRPDHWVVFGLDDAPGEWGSPVAYRRPPGPLADFLPQRVIGQAVDDGYLRNGDFVLSVEDARAGRLDGLARLTPRGERVPVAAVPVPPPAPAPPPRTQPRWLVPLLATVGILLLAGFCFGFLIWGP
jgi:hypothetical protein